MPPPGVALAVIDSRSETIGYVSPREAARYIEAGMADPLGTKQRIRKLRARPGYEDDFRTPRQWKANKEPEQQQN